MTASCEPEQVRFSYDGAAEQVYGINNWPANYGNPDPPGSNRIASRLGLGVYRFVYTPENATTQVPFPESLAEGVAWPVHTALLADATEQTLGPIRCVGEGSGSTMARRGEDLLFDLKNVDVIETCRDNPIEGQINLCFQFGGCDASFDGGTVAGTPWTLQPNEWIGVNGIWDVDFADGTWMRAATSNSVTGPAYWALIVTHSASAYGGQIFCASGGSVESAGEEPFDYDVLRFTDLGVISCGAGTGTAQGCLRGD